MSYFCVMIRFSKHLHRRCPSYSSQLAAFRRASTLVIAEHDNMTLSPSSLSAVTAAGELKGDVTLLIVGHESHSVVQQVIHPPLLSRSSTWELHRRRHCYKYCWYVTCYQIPPDICAGHRTPSSPWLSGSKGFRCLQGPSC